MNFSLGIQSLYGAFQSLLKLDSPCSVCIRGVKEGRREVWRDMREMCAYVHVEVKPGVSKQHN